MTLCYSGSFWINSFDTIYHYDWLKNIHFCKRFWYAEFYKIKVDEAC